MQKQIEYISHRAALQMLDMGVKTFNKVIVPHVSMAVINRKKFYKIDQLNKFIRLNEVITIK